MPPKKVRNCLESDVRKKRIARRIRRLRQSEEQRETMRIKARERRFNARKHAQSQDLFTQQFQVTMCQDLYETIRNHKTQQGRRLCEPFIRAPNRWSLPDYYDIVTSPIDLLKIQQKLKAKEYTDVRQLTSDIELMVNNAKMYYKKESIEYQNACELWKVFFDAKISKEEEYESKKKDHQAATLRKATEMKKRKRYSEKNTKIKRAADRIGRLQETDEHRQQRISRCSHNNNLKNEAQSRTKIRDLQQAATLRKATVMKKKKPYSEKNTKKKRLPCGRIDLENESKHEDAQSRVPTHLENMENLELSRKMKMSLKSHGKFRKKESAAIKPSDSDPTTFIIDAPPPIKDLVTQPTRDYVFQGKCKKCNFSDIIQVYSETEDGCNTGIVLKCMLCPTTKVIGIEDPSMENTHSKSQDPRIVFSQVAPIEQELILPDDRSFIRSSSELARVEMKFCVDQDESTTEPGSVSSDTCTMMDAQLQQSINVDSPQATSIKQELILPDDVASLSPINSLLEPIGVKKTFCVNQDGSNSKLKSEPTLNIQLKNGPLNGQLSSSSATVVTTNCDITPMEVDLNLVKKEVDD